MKTLSVKQPWAYLLCAGIKDVENRTWKLPEKYKGEWTLIHASADIKFKNLATLTDEQVFDCIAKINALHSDTENIFHPANCMYDAFLHEGFPNRVFSAIVGAIRFSDCVINHQSIWAESTNGEKLIYNWVVSEAILFNKPMLGIKGKLSFWDFDIPEEYKKLITN